MALRSLSWGYRWINHEFGHTVGLPDLYSYNTTIGGTRVNQFFWVGGWNIMGNIGGHANDYSGFEKYKLRWLRDDQVDGVSTAGTTPHAITPLETPGGSKIVVIRTGVSTADSATDSGSGTGSGEASCVRSAPACR